jgi:hypothetical protein
MLTDHDIELPARFSSDALNAVVRHNYVYTVAFFLAFDVVGARVFHCQSFISVSTHAS